jgi:hypothetical protein
MAKRDSIENKAPDDRAVRHYRRSLLCCAASKRILVYFARLHYRRSDTAREIRVFDPDRSVRSRRDGHSDMRMHPNACVYAKKGSERDRDITAWIYIYTGCVNVPFVRDRLPSKSPESSSSLASSLASSLPDRIQLFVCCRRERMLIEPGAQSYHLDEVKGSLAGAVQSNVYISRSKIV